jgi:hypothetical protein
MVRIPATPSPDKVTRLRLARAASEGRVLHVPVRRVIVKSPKRILRELVSVKMASVVPCESAIEFDHFTVLDVDPSVVRFRVQPEWIAYVDAEGLNHVTAPDVLVEYRGGAAEFHEVKPTDRTKEECAAIAAACLRRGIVYRVVQADEVRREPRIGNARALRAARWARPSPETAWAARSRLARTGPTSLGMLVAALGGGDGARADVLSMALRGQLAIDWESRPIGPDTSIALPEDGTPRADAGICRKPSIQQGENP